MNEIPIDMSAVNEVISLEKKNRKTKKMGGASLSERTARTEETIDKIQNRILRRKKIVEDIENKYQKQGVALPENIQLQYDNTKAKIHELEDVYEEKVKELEMFMRTLSNTENT